MLRDFPRDSCNSRMRFFAPNSGSKPLIDTRAETEPEDIIEFLSVRVGSRPS
ncbi:hypothetical protein C8K38_11072 [Rhodococcus sp. OK611]|nr:hypothetical protein C8K38_11072 [Rhodococcus sp. OK611]SNX91868.1 hypothetical protein SAMN05447004_111155 [Rhodococcus sp. OK270]